MSPIMLEVQHTPQTISSLSYVQYSATHGLKKCVQVITAVICLLLGTRLVGSIEPPFNYLFSAYGCFAILFLNLPAKWRSEKIIRQIQASKRGFPRSVFRFGEDGFHVKTKGVKGKGDFSPTATATGFWSTTAVCTTSSTGKPHSYSRPKA